MRSFVVLLLALGLIGIGAGCANNGSTVRTKQGAVGGAAVGAVVGGIVGHQSGRGLEGAAIGGALGGVGGAVVGSAADEKSNAQQQSAP